MNKHETDILELSFFDKKVLSPVQIHEAQKVQKSLYDSLHTIYHNVHLQYKIDYTAYEQDPHVHKSRLDSLKDIVCKNDDRVTLAQKFAARYTSDHFSKLIKITKDDVLAYKFTSDIIAKFAEHSSEQYEIQHVVPRSILDLVIPTSVIQNYNDKNCENIKAAIQELKEITPQIRKPGSSPEVKHQFFDAYFKALSEVAQYLRNDLGKARDIIGRDLNYGNKVPNVVVNNARYEAVTTQYNLDLLK